MSNAPNLRLIDPNLGDLFTIEEFTKYCELGGFIDYDGMGNWATATHVEYGRNAEGDPKWIYPSQIVKREITAPEWATHVLWYNR